MENAVDILREAFEQIDELHREGKTKELKAIAAFDVGEGVQVFMHGTPATMVELIVGLILSYKANAKDNLFADVMLTAAVMKVLDLGEDGIDSFKRTIKDLGSGARDDLN